MFPYKIDKDIKLTLPDPDRDAQALFNLIQQNIERINHWLPWAHLMHSLDDEKVFLQGTLTSFKNNKSLILVILYHDQVAGMISFNQINHNRKSADIGYWLGQDFVGNGIMHRSLRGMCEIGFSNYNLNKIIINAAVDNYNSNQVAKKASFHLDGVLRANELLPDGFHDENTWSLLRSEFINIEK